MVSPKLALLSTILFLSGCGSGANSSALAGASTPAGASAQQATEVQLSVTPTSPIVGFEASRQLEAVVWLNDGSSRNVTPMVTWSSDDPRFVTVSGGGLVTGKRVGSTRVRATLGSLLAVEPIRVSPLPASGRFRSFRYVHFEGFGHNGGLAVGDYNEDGRDDLIRLDRGFTPTVDLLLGDGAGNFTRSAINPGALPAFFSTDQVLVKDLTGDGHLDAVVLLSNQVPATPPRSGYVILVGNGQGQFTARPPVLFTLACGTGALGDFNGDGRFDLALPQNPGVVSNDVVIAPGLPTGDFGPLVGTSLLASSRWLSAGRFGPDLFDDIVTGLGATAGLLDGRADGNFMLPPEILNGLTFGAHIADFNGDGSNDLALSREDSVEFFQRLSGARPVSAGSWSGGKRYNLLSGDFNGDGRRDLTGDASEGALLSFNRGNFQAADSAMISLPQGVIYAFLAGGNPSRGISSGPTTVVMDFNRDGISDLAHQSADHGLFLVAGEAGGNLACPQFFADLATLCQATSGDFNEDGLADFVGVSPTAGDICTLLSQGSGNYQTGASPLPPMQGLQLSKADLNQDGHLDLVVAGNASTNLILTPGNGQGQFSAPTQIDIGQTVVQFLVQDLNGDNVPDLLAGSANQVSVFLNNGQGQMQRQADLTSGGVQLACDDYNRDGLMDLATAVSSAGPLQIRFGNGNGTFAAPTNTALRLSALASLDLNRDGVADLAVATPTGVVAMMNNGNGVFTAGPTLFSQSAFAPKGLLAADLNLDGFRDLVGSVDPYNIAVLFSEPAGLGAARIFALDRVPERLLEVADIQGDGIPDLIRISPKASALVGL